MKQNLQIAEDLSLPIDAVTQKLAWIGTTGSGKTYGASKLAELMWDVSAQFVVLDPVGVWYGLRLAKDGKHPSDINIPIFGGLHGDVPLEQTAGAMMADLIADRALTAILDVSQFESDAAKARFAADFADRFFFRKKAAPSAVHLFLEECQEFVPENQQRGEERMKHVFVRMQKIGRNYGIGTSYITQRPQDVSKKALNLAQTPFVFRTTGSHERAAINTWIKDKAIEDQDIASELPKLKTGEPHVWSPEWLQISKVVKILEKRTFNASATPEVGAVAKSRELAPIDLEKIRTEMAATIEKASANDPTLLKRRIAELQKKIAAKPSPTAEIKRVEVPVVTDAQIKKIETIVERLEREGRQRIEAAEKMAETGRNLIETGKQFAAALGKAAPVASAPAHRPGIVTAPRFLPPPQIPKSTGGGDQQDLSGPEKRIVDAIAWLESIGVSEPEKTAVAFLASYTYGSGGFNNPCGSLRAKGLIQYAPREKILLTDAGRAIADFPDEVLTDARLHEKVLGKLPGPEQRLLKPLLDAYPDVMSNEDLAAAAGYTHGSGGFNNPRGRLRSLGLVEYRDGGVAARGILFPEGGGVATELFD